MAEYFINGDIVLASGLHVGAGKGERPADSPVRRAGDGRLLIPGRAIGGSLRTLATRLAPRLGLVGCQALLHRDDPGYKPAESCPCPVCRLFGNVHPVDRPDNIPKGKWTPSRASALWVYDASLAADQPTCVRDGVGIDRRSGAASRQVKFDYETVPAGTRFGLRLRLWTDNEVDLPLLAAALAEWAAGRGSLGGNVARGLGRFHLDGLTYCQTELTDAAGLMGYLRADDQAALAKPVTERWLAKARKEVTPRQREDRVAAGAFLTVDFHLAFCDLSLVNDPLMSLLAGFDHAPLVEMVADKASRRPVLPGSSLRGVLRSHAEKIARTLATNHWYDPNDERHGMGNFGQHCPACNPLAREKGDPLASCDSRLKVPDREETPERALCLACQLFGSQRRGSRLWLRDAYLADDRPLDEKDWKAQDFLAIDRFTGGGLEKAKFDAAALVQARFAGQLVLHDPRGWELGWLALLLRDLAEGMLTVGFGAAKGYGRLKGEGFKWTVGYLHETDCQEWGLPKLDGQAGKGLYQELVHQVESGWLPADWQAAAGQWVVKFNEMIKEPKYDEEWQPVEQDSFLGHQEMVKQYGVSRAGLEEVGRHG
jgi:CRISPR/Cas system CSM-associated protein Csm3 (group 7 of RAMP superfamily)